MVNYHGPTPVSKADFKMAKKHLKNTQDLLENKISDHEDAKEDAQDAGNQKSVSYNQSHLQGHKKDLSKVEKSIDTLKSMKKSSGLSNYLSNKKGSRMAFNTKKTGTYKGRSNAPGGGGRFKQMTDKGVSPALASFIGRKKFGAKTFASMSAKGKSNGQVNN